MIAKQDRQGVRKASDIEQKYDLNVDYSAIEKTANEAKRVADIANTRVTNLGGEVSDAVSDIEALDQKASDLNKRVEILENGASAGVDFTTDETLTLKDGVLSVNTANVVEADNTLPVTSAAVNVTVGNIEALLETI